jgi:profilin
MSWDSYRDNLIASQCLDKVVICGIPDGSIWSQSPGLTVKPDEVKTIIAGFKKGPGRDALAAKGIYFSGIKYWFILGEDNEIQGKLGTAGLSIAKSNKCMIIGIYKDGQQPGNARARVEAMRDYLKNSGY